MNIFERQNTNNEPIKKLQLFSVKEEHDLDLLVHQDQVPSSEFHVPKTTLSIAAVRFRQPASSGLSRLASSRRHDQRYHSNPIIPVMTEITGQDMFIDEMRKTLAVPVSERRKFFERVAEYNSPF